MITFNQSVFLYQSLTFLPNSTFYRVMKGFHETFVKDVACRQGTLFPSDTWSCPIKELHKFYLLRPILFPNLSFFSGLYALRKSPGTFSILLHTIDKLKLKDPGTALMDTKPIQV